MVFKSEVNLFPNRTPVGIYLLSLMPVLFNPTAFVYFSGFLVGLLSFYDHRVYVHGALLKYSYPFSHFFHVTTTNFNVMELLFTTKDLKSRLCIYYLSPFTLILLNKIRSDLISK